MRARPSPNCDERASGAVVDTLVLHYTGMPSAAAALDRLCDPDARVSAHYLIDEDGSVTALVPEALRAWHAGVSAWRGRAGVNDTSIGIELVNPGHEWGYRPFPEPQYAACIELCRGIVERWPILARNFVGHSDVAPERKADPGELFDWRRLAGAGLGLWPDHGHGRARPPGELQAQLAEVGYPIAISGRLDPPTKRVIAAFQRRFRPRLVDGEPDRETRARLDGLLALI
jgi:N-acetylmuramoyl-L-alanine amidase